MKRRFFFKTLAGFFASLFSFRQARASTDNLKVKVIYHDDQYLKVSEYETQATGWDIPREALDKYPYAFDIQLSQNGKLVHQWFCENLPTNKRYPANDPIVLVSEWMWKERSFFENGEGGPWVLSFFNGPTHRRVFYFNAHIDPQKAEKFLTTLKTKLKKVS
jgi:hypothetical protein